MSAPQRAEGELRRVTRERWGWTIMLTALLVCLASNAWQHDALGVAVSTLGVVVCAFPAFVEWAERWGLT